MCEHKQTKIDIQFDECYECCKEEKLKQEKQK